MQTDYIKQSKRIMQTNHVKIALAGNPNVGKSTIFNALTGMKQHTGNWPGKTVGSAVGSFTYRSDTAHSLSGGNMWEFTVVDLPGTYSLVSASEDEEIAESYICSGEADLVLAVADACCLERNLSLILQIREITHRLVLCVNLLDEAEKKGITIDLEKLGSTLDCPVIGISAKNKKDIERLKSFLLLWLEKYREVPRISGGCENNANRLKELYPSPEATVKEAHEIYRKCVNFREESKQNLSISKEFCAVRHACNCSSQGAHKCVGCCTVSDIHQTKSGASGNDHKTEGCTESSVHKTEDYAVYDVHKYDRKIDGIVTSKLFGFPIMLLLLTMIFWLTIKGANYPSLLLSDFFAWLERHLEKFCVAVNMHPVLQSALLDGIYGMLSRVIAVMLPPMAIFFPLFTLLEDFGYLPRIAFNMDGAFKKSGACGKQCLTMMMGFGCNACGVTGCRIIESKREKLIAILTNSFVPCNGKFPTLIALSMILFSCTSIADGGRAAAFSVLMLSGLVTLSVVATLLASRLLSASILRGAPSSFVLELPPYRRPQVGSILVRSLIDRTLAILLRAVRVAAPAGLLLWFLANFGMDEGSGSLALQYCGSVIETESVQNNTSYGFGDSISLLSVLTQALEAPSGLFGLDGTILSAFLLAFPANEMIVPVMLMAYSESGTLTDFGNIAELGSILSAYGWSEATALCTIIFTLFHFPCATTLLTIKKETGNFKWSLLAFVLPTVFGLTLCFLINTVCTVV